MIRSLCLRALSLPALIATCLSVPAQDTTAVAAADPFAALAAMVPATPDPRRNSVRIERPDGTAAHAAIVVFLPALPDDELAALQQEGHANWPDDEPRRCAALARHGVRLQVDANACVRPPGAGRLLAFAGEFVGDRFVDASETTVALQPPHTCTVEVVDADGRPTAGVPFALVDAQFVARQSRHTTGADGTCTLRALVRRPEAHRLVLDFPTAMRIATALPANGGRVRLQMPPTTAVEATFVGESTPGYGLSFRLRGTLDSFDGEPIGERGARWPWVGIGTQALVGVRRSGVATAARELASATIVVQASGEPLRLGGTLLQPMVAVQVLAHDGLPARDRALALRLRHADETLDVRLRTNGEGWTEFDLPHRFADDQPVTVQLDLRAAERAATAGSPARHSAALLPRRIGRAQFEVRVRGPLQIVHAAVPCGPLPVLARGQLVGTRQAGNEPGDDRHTSDQVSAEPAPLAGIALRVQIGPDAQITTDADGRFEVRGDAADTSRGGLTVELEPAWCFVDGEPWRRTLPLANADTQLRVQPSVRVAVADDVAAPDLSPIEYRLESLQHDGGHVAIRVDWQRRELWMPPNGWSLVPHSNGHALARWTPATAAAPFDWHAFARLVELRLVDHAGHLIADALIVDRATRAQNRPANGRVRLLVPHHGGDFDVCPNHGRLPTLSLFGLDTDRTVVLDLRPQLTLRLRPQPQLPNDVELVLAVGDGDGLPFAADGVAALPVPQAGAFVPTIHLRRGAVRSQPLAWQLSTIDVPADGTSVAVELTEARAHELQRRIDALPAR